MKKTYLFLSISLLVGLVVGCGGSDDPGADLLADAPSGEIVAVQLRDEVLTGVSPAGRGDQELKWWRQVVTVTKFTPACGEEDDEIQSGAYIAFDPSGDLRQSSTNSGTGFVTASWQWASAAKDAVLLTRDGESAQFTIRSLNETQVVYASVQVIGGGCSVASWDEFVR